MFCILQGKESLKTYIIVEAYRHKVVNKYAVTIRSQRGTESIT